MAIPTVPNAAPAAPAAPSAPVDLKTLWTQVLESVSRISLFTHSYLVNAHPVSFEKQVLTIGFPLEFADQVDLVDNAKNRKILQEVLKDLGCGDVNLKMVKTREPAAPAAPVPAARPAPAPRRKKPEPAPATSAPAPAVRTEAAPPPSISKEEFRNDPLIKQALEIFKGQLVEIKS